jgi:hypothetical protein
MQCRFELARECDGIEKRRIKQPLPHFAAKRCKLSHIG